EGVKNNLSQTLYKAGLREGKFYKIFSKMWKNPIDKIFQHLSVNSNDFLTKIILQMICRIITLSLL
ncbi:MAG: hypothetical protein J6E46_00080, partial [Faecalicoccus sp.]|nr:hypothetical protein [Faecalicoccus sp.]